jgi:hypothetical protein
MKSALLALLPLVAASPVVVPTQADGPDPGTVRIRGVTYGGSGCPQGSVSVQLSSDQTLVTLIFDEYIASIGPDVSVGDQRKNCQLNFALTYPGGFQYSVFQADYRGYADLDAGVTGTMKSTYYFSGQSQQTSTEAVFQGPLNGDYLKSDEADQVSLVWSPCGAEGMLNVNSQVRLTSNNRNAKGLLTTDSIDAKFVQKLAVRWRTCRE